MACRHRQAQVPSISLGCIVVGVEALLLVEAATDRSARMQVMKHAGGIPHERGGTWRKASCCQQMAVTGRTSCL